MNSLGSNQSALIVESDSLLARELAEALRPGGYNSAICQSGHEALQATERRTFDLTLLAVDLRDFSAVDLMSALRESSGSKCFIVLTPSDAGQLRIAAIKAGASDFLITPISRREVLARAEAALVRSQRLPQAKLQVGPVSLDLDRRKAQRDEQTLSLTPTELRILEILMKHQGTVVTRKMLCSLLWTPDWTGATNVIEVHINRLRRKVERDGPPQLIQTIRGQGYRMQWTEPPVRQPAVGQPNTASTAAGL